MQALIQGTTLLEVSRVISCDQSCDQRWERVREDVACDEFKVSISGVPESRLIAAVKVANLNKTWKYHEGFVLQLLMIEEEKYDVMQRYIMDEDG